MSRKLLQIVLMICFVNELLGQCLVCDTCYLRYPIREMQGPHVAYPMLDTIFLRESRFDTTYGFDNYYNSSTQIQIEYDSLTHIGFIRNQTKQSVIQGYFDLELMQDTGEFGICPCYDMKLNGVWIAMYGRDTLLNYWIAHYVDDQATGLFVRKQDGVTMDSGYYNQNKYTGTWITAANNWAKEVAIYDSVGRPVRRTFYRNYQTSKVKMETTIEYEKFSIFLDSIQGTVVYDNRHNDVHYDSSGKVQTMVIYYLSDMFGPTFEFYQRFQSNGQIFVEAKTVDGITTVVHRYPNGTIKSTEYYAGLSMEITGYSENFYGMKVGTHTFNKPDGSLDHAESYSQY